MEPFEMKFKIYMEAEDIGQSRIHTSIAFLKNCLENSRNSYLHGADYDDASDPEIREEDCASCQDAFDFVMDLAQILDSAAAAHSFLDLEGEFSWKFRGEDKQYTFRSEGGSDVCDFIEHPAKRQEENHETGRRTTANTAPDRP